MFFIVFCCYCYLCCYHYFHYYNYTISVLLSPFFTSCIINRLGNDDIGNDDIAVTGRHNSVGYTDGKPGHCILRTHSRRPPREH